MTNKQPVPETPPEEDRLEDRVYDPNRLLDTLIQHLNLKNDAALSRALEVAPPVISKIRHHRLPVGASLLIRMHEVSELSIKELRRLMGDRRAIQAEAFRRQGLSEVLTTHKRCKAKTARNGPFGYGIVTVGARYRSPDATVFLPAGYVRPTRLVPEQTE